MPLYVANRRRTTLRREFPDALVIDVTSRADEPWVRLSPFYPHGGIPVPGHPERTSRSVEGVWQALKVFATEQEDFAKLDIATMKGIKRTVRRLGAPLGHRLDGTLLDYEQARRLIYLPTYRWVLENRVPELVAELRKLSADRDVVLLDYTTNGDVADLSSPLSHAALVVQWVEGRRW
ncbi:hypothetical protein DFR70_101828 [Nocardia tenerifensis]|uniref:Uncharacterized protein n=2 Tax=Nocardia tenerifensis TaxID=228006 RepID=A0A318KBA9_9NOCA|nr:hypothetical protein [Nocardia tenerifensis]PXX71406.1 hypothetical protein DFR70_101828 [Nocardia tenerifensis]